MVPLDLRIDLEPTLPLRLEQLTPRVREAVKFLSGATGLQPLPPRQVDVLDVRPGLLSTTWKMVKRRPAGRGGEGGKRARG